MIANVSCQLANTLLATAAHFNQGISFVALARVICDSVLKYLVVNIYKMRQLVLAVGTFSGRKTVVKLSFSYFATIATETWQLVNIG